MTLRTPRRRISPRTKRRYRAIKDFLRRALGSTSQPDIKINSSIAVNVTNLKHQIVGIEQQLNEVSRHLICTECTSTNESTSSFPRDKSIGTETIILRPDTSTERNSRESKTKLLYKTLNDRKSDDSDLQEKSESDRHELKHVDSKKAKASSKTNTKAKKARQRLNEEPNMDDIHPCYSKHKSKSAYERFSSALSTNSYHSLIDPREHGHGHHEDHHHTRHSSGHGRHRAHERGPERSREIDVQRDVQHEPKDISGKRTIRNEERHVRRRKEKHSRDIHELDPDFINNIIKRQYRPVKMFGRRQSDLSQFSAPICRDQEFTIPENILEGSDLCSCCYADRKNRCVPYSNVSDMRSICDTRLYSSKRNTRHKMYNYNYNDSSMYDVVPVKEKCSPKSRRKFTEDVMCYSQYKEVPPSPRTLRPRLNLKSQHFSNMDFDEDDHHRSRKYSPNRNNRHHNDYMDSYSNKSFTVVGEKSLYNSQQNKQANVQQKIGASNYRESMPSPLYSNEITNINQVQVANTTTNKSQDTESTTDKTDKALCEIKDILQNFLQEIKKESISHITKETNVKSDQDQSTEIKHNNIKPNISFEEPTCNSETNNCSIGPFPIPPSYLTPPYLNPCCYPVFPSYPMNCMQNSFVVPSPSYTCATCNKLDQPIDDNKENIKNNNTKTNNKTETDKLIKEIYNLVTQSPQTARKREGKSDTSHRKASDKKRPVVTRSVGDSIRITRHDAKVGTPKLKYYSKSCEAIGSPLDEEHTSRTTASYSDTLLDKLSLDATAADTTSTETEMSTDPTTTTTEKKDEGNRFSKVLRSFGLLKKKKNDVIEEENEEESESESSTEVEIKKKRKRPEFPQEVINYSMHGQEYFHLPPLPPHIQPHLHHESPPLLHHEPPRHYHDLPPHLHHDYLPHQQNMLHTHFSPYPGYPGQLIQPTAPPCPYTNANPDYHQNPYHKQPEVPLCLKEIEVKSTATQSDRKLAFFGKFGKKKPIEIQTLTPRNSMSPPKNCSTQTAQNKPGFWQKLNTPKPITESDPRMFSFKKQKELAAGDAKLKNIMLKKLFHKRNPFSPNNLIVKTLMGRDPSSFGEPPVMYRPRMFL